MYLRGRFRTLTSICICLTPKGLSSLHYAASFPINHSLNFPGGSAVKNPPATQETGVHSLRREDPLKEGMTTHSSILAWKIPKTEESSGSMGSQKVRPD